MCIPLCSIPPPMFSQLFTGNQSIIIANLIDFPYISDRSIYHWHVQPSAPSSSPLKIQNLKLRFSLNSKIIFSAISFLFSVPSSFMWVQSLTLKYVEFSKRLNLFSPNFDFFLYICNYCFPPGLQLPISYIFHRRRR